MSWKSQTPGYSGWQMLSLTKLQNQRPSANNAIIALTKYHLPSAERGPPLHLAAQGQGTAQVKHKKTSLRLTANTKLGKKGISSILKWNCIIYSALFDNKVFLPAPSCDHL